MPVHPWLICYTQKLPLSGGAHVHAVWAFPVICCTSDKWPRCCGGVCTQAEKGKCLEGCHAHQSGRITVTGWLGKWLQVVPEGLSSLSATSEDVLTQNSR